MKKTLKISGILCLVASIFNIVTLVIDILSPEFSIYIIVIDSLSVLLSVITGIVYLLSLKKTEEQIIKRNGLYYALLILNIFNSLIVWFISFWVSMAVNNANLKKNAVYLNGNENLGKDTQGENSSTNISRENLEVSRNVMRLTERLNELEELKKSKQITEEEYESLRKKLLDSL